MAPGLSLLVSKEACYSVKRVLLQCQKRPRRSGTPCIRQSMAPGWRRSARTTGCGMCIKILLDVTRPKMSRDMIPFSLSAKPPQEKRLA